MSSLPTKSTRHTLDIMPSLSAFARAPIILAFVGVGCSAPLVDDPVAVLAVIDHSIAAGIGDTSRRVEQAGGVACERT